MIRVFSHYVPKSLIYLGIIETFIFFASLYLGVVFRFTSNFSESFEDGAPLFVRAIIYTMVMMASMTGVGLYQRHLRDKMRGIVFRLIVAFAAGFTVMSIVFYIAGDYLVIGRGVFFISILFAFLGVVLARLIYMRLTHQEMTKKRVLVIGAGQTASLIEQKFKRKSDRVGFKIVGYLVLPGEQTKVDPQLTIELHGPLVEYVEQNDIDELVVAVTDRRNVFPVHQLLDCKLSGIEVVDLLAFFERQSGVIMLEVLNPSWLIFTPGFKQGIFRDFLKRTFDLVVSSTILFLTLPVMVFAAIIVFLEDRGPIFYKQVRVGKNWKLIRVIKFRSMRVDAEKNGAQFASKNDSRITRIGAFMRKTRIDELPQLFNVLKGDMSFVGPRPERPEFVEGFSLNIPYYSERHRVKPGLTGWAQISYPYGSGLQDTVQKLQYDLYYVKNYSLFLDLTVLLLTIEVVLWGKGAR